MTCEPSQRTLWPETELPPMSSREASRAKTLAWRESSAVWGKEPVPACGPKSSDLLATYDPVTSSWRTSQTCLVALTSGQEDGLGEFSETWPPSGIMRSGRTFQRPPWALPISEAASGLWPTPNSCKASNDIRLNCSGDGRKRPNKLGWAVSAERVPTPTATMFKGSSPASLTRKSGKSRERDRLDHWLQSTEGTGDLNPEWVGWLMGFPEGWLNLD
jgi:hypothetical protein